jgi:hypothetical protein
MEERYHAALECDPAELVALPAPAEPDVRRNVASLLAKRIDDFALTNPATFTTAALRETDRPGCRK